MIECTALAQWQSNFTDHPFVTGPIASKRHTQDRNGQLEEWAQQFGSHLVGICVLYGVQLQQEMSHLPVHSPDARVWSHSTECRYVSPHVYSRLCFIGPVGRLHFQCPAVLNLDGDLLWGHSL